MIMRGMDHIKRLEYSANVYRMPMHYTVELLHAAIILPVDSLWGLLLPWPKTSESTASPTSQTLTPPTAHRTTTTCSGGTLQQAIGSAPRWTATAVCVP